jgi:lipoprotein-anchoring transpeptidase ErfK/SrfK
MKENAHINICLTTQHLQVLSAESVLFEAAISSGLNGPGEQDGSGCTPRGAHEVVEIIGEDVAINTVFVGRKPTGEVYTPALGLQYPERDWILTRIIWLGGLEVGKNWLGDVDTMRRYIYIHGCPDSCEMGVPLSHGCVRMHNEDVLALMPFVTRGMQVMIHG